MMNETRLIDFASKFLTARVHVHLYVLEFDMVSNGHKKKRGKVEVNEAGKQKEEDLSLTLLLHT